MASFASSVTTGGALKHAWTNYKIYQIILVPMAHLLAMICLPFVKNAAWCEGGSYWGGEGFIDLEQIGWLLFFVERAGKC